MVYIGSFFLLNLTLAVINNSFNETQEKNEQEKKAKEEETLFLHEKRMK